MKNLIQLSMDGPNVNWAVHREINDTINATHAGRKLLNVGSCGLHITHNAFRKGCKSSGWNIDTTLSSFYDLFKESPARREDYLITSQDDVWPQKFCTVRWLENISVAEQALKCLPHLSAYIKAAMKKEVSMPKTKTFETAKSSIDDPLLEVKLHVFISVAKDIEPFLERYPTDAPLLPIMVNALTLLTYNLCKRFIKEDQLPDSTSVVSLIRLDVEDETKQKEVMEIDIGFAAKERLKKIKATKKVSGLQIYRFRNECKLLFIQTAKKLLEKSPLVHPLVRHAAILDPNVMTSSSDSVLRKQIHEILAILTSSGRIDSGKADGIINELSMFRASLLSNSIDFDSDTERLDDFYRVNMAGKKEYGKAMELMQLILCLSHGQATVERGFSINDKVNNKFVKVCAVSCSSCFVITCYCDFIYIVFRQN